MGSFFEINGIIGLAILAAPIVLVFAAIILSLFWPSRKEHPALPMKSPAMVEGEGEAGAVAEERSPQLGAEEPNGGESILTPFSFIPRSPSAASRTRGSGTSEHGDRHSHPPPSPADAPPQDSDPASMEIRAIIDEALAKRAEGDENAAADSLRAAIIKATKARKPLLHASARLELGDIAHAEGDLTTACEHWQMARSMFEDEKRAQNASDCEKRMTRNGCPTDWVLNDF